MNEQQAMLQSIYDNLEDDTVRLVYADWLDEHGDSDRAELIRLQYELYGRETTLTPNGIEAHENYERKRELYGRQSELIGNHREWIQIECPCTGLTGGNINRPKLVPLLNCPMCRGIGNLLFTSRIYWRTGFIDKIEVPELGQIFRENDPTQWAIALVKAVPTLMKLVPLDRHPRLADRADCSYGWQRDSYFNNFWEDRFGERGYQYGIPDPLWERLQGGYTALGNEESVRYYKTEKEGIDALGSTIVRLLKERKD